MLLLFVALRRHYVIFVELLRYDYEVIRLDALIFQVEFEESYWSIVTIPTENLVAK